MSLRSKTLAYVVMAIAALVGATLWVIDGVVMRELTEAEHEETSAKVADVHSVVQRCVSEYVDSFSDWTEWDDMAKFLENGNEEFLKSNVNVASLGEQIHADCFVVERADGTVVYSTQLDPARKALGPCSSEFLAHLTPRGLMRPGNSYGGILALRDYTYVVASRPIHKSDYKSGPVEGRMITAQRVDDTWIQRLKDFTFLQISFSRVSETPFEAEELEAREALAAGAASFVSESGPDCISGYGLLQDLYGAPALVMHLSRSRGVHVHGREILDWTMLTMISGGMVLCLLSLWVTGRGALRPLQRLLSGTHKLQRGERTHVVVRSGDEFEQLGQAFNHMSDAIFEREEALKGAHQELARLFDGMAEAIVAFGPDGCVSGHASRKAHEVFGRAVLAGVALRDLLYPGADEYDIEAEAFQAWLTVAFTQPLASWEQVVELAPKHVVLRRGASDEAHLTLGFRAIVIGEQIHRVLLLATDETEKHHMLQHQAERESAHGRQLQAMRKLLAGGAQVFVNFVRSSHTRLDELDALLRERPSALDAADVELLFRHAHTLQGEARVFDIEKLEYAAGALEEELAQLRAEARTSPGGSTGRTERLRELLAAARSALDEAQELFVRASPIGEAILDQMAVRRSDVQALDELTRQLARSGAGPQLAAVRALVERLHARPFGELCSAFIERVPLWAEKLGKRATLEIEGRDVPIPPALAQRLPGALTHLLRNAVSHGIETPEQRERAHKEPVGRVRLCASAGADGPRFSVEDDGAGLDLRALAARAAELGQPVVAGEEWRLVFVAGLSTASATDEYSGRGVGMGAVRDELAQAGYEVAIEFEPGRHTRITLSRTSRALKGAA